MDISTYIIISLLIALGMLIYEYTTISWYDSRISLLIAFVVAWPVMLPYVIFLMLMDCVQDIKRIIYEKL